MYCNTVTLDGYEVFSDFNGYLKWIYLVDDNCGLIVSTFWVATAWFWVATEWAVGHFWTFKRRMRCAKMFIFEK